MVFNTRFVITIYFLRISVTLSLLVCLLKRLFVCWLVCLFVGWLPAELTIQHLILRGLPSAAQARMTEHQISWMSWVLVQRIEQQTTHRCVLVGLRLKIDALEAGFGGRDKSQEPKDSPSAWQLFQSIELSCSPRALPTFESLYDCLGVCLFVCVWVYVDVCVCVFS